MRKTLQDQHCKIDIIIWKYRINTTQHLCHYSVLLSVPTNLCANATVDRLVEKGFPQAQILHVVGEQANVSLKAMFNHRTVRITKYKHDNDIQLIVATVRVMPKLYLLKNTKKGLQQKPALLFLVIEHLNDIFTNCT